MSPRARLRLETCPLCPDDRGWMLFASHTASAALSAIRLEYLEPLEALGLFLLLAVPIVLLGWRPLAALGPVRRWVAIGARLLVVALTVLILAGLRMERE